jgi:hypothetical protein
VNQNRARQLQRAGEFICSWLTAATFLCALSAETEAARLSLSPCVISSLWQRQTTIGGGPKGATRTQSCDHFSLYLLTSTAYAHHIGPESALLFIRLRDERFIWPGDDAAAPLFPELKIDAALR